MKRIRALLPAVAVAIILLAIGACGSRESTGKQVLTVSLPPQQYMLERIVGDIYDVRCLLATGVDPESYEPSLSLLMDVERSRAYFMAGHIGFEKAVVSRVRANNPELTVVDTSEGIDLIAGSHGDSLEIDPHTWSSAANGRIMAANMLKAMCQLDPSNKSVFETNYSKLSAHIDSVDSVLHVRLAPLGGTAFLVWHPSLSYFARDYGLVQLSVEAEGKESSVAALREVVDKARTQQVRALFIQKSFDRRQVATLASELEIEPTVINPLNYEWDAELIATGDAIVSSVD